MKYANGTIFVCGKQCKAFVCAKTFKRIKEILKEYNISQNCFQNYWSKTGNDKMQKIAKDTEGVWISNGLNYDNFKQTKVGKE